jgi:hypothetical protein
VFDREEPVIKGFKNGTEDKGRRWGKAGKRNGKPRTRLRDTHMLSQLLHYPVLTGCGETERLLWRLSLCLYYSLSRTGLSWTYRVKPRRLWLILVWAVGCKLV